MFVCFSLRNTNTGFIRRTDASGQCQKPALKMKTDGVGSRVPYWKKPCWRSKAWSFLKRLNVGILSSRSHNLLGFLPSSWDLMHERFIELQENNRLQKGRVVIKLLWQCWWEARVYLDWTFTCKDFIIYKEREFEKVQLCERLGQQKSFLLPFYS